MATLPIRIATTIVDEIENVYDDITKRAYELFLHPHGICTLDIEEWLAAERQLLWKPEVRLTEKRELFIVRMALTGIDPATVNILVTTDDLVVQSTANSRYPRIFRAVHFPQPINPARVHALCVKEKLVFIAMKIAVSESFGAVRAPAATPASRNVHKEDGPNSICIARFSSSRFELQDCRKSKRKRTR